MSNHLDQDRARTAVEQVKYRANDAWEQYNTVLKSAVTQIRQIGLLQVIQFWLSKRDDEKGRLGEVRVLEDLVAWLCISRTTKHVCNAQPEIKYRVGDRNGLNLADALTSRNTGELRLLEDESRKYLDWLSRIAEGLTNETN